MESILIKNLKAKVQELKRMGVTDSDSQINSIKQELQAYVLNFIYHDSEYKDWVMYGGSLLRFAHGLSRMSVDLDFEVKKMPDFKELSNKLSEYFEKNYNVDSSVLYVAIKKRGLELRFDIAHKLDIIHISPKIYVKIDFNEFYSKKATTEIIVINEKDLVFNIKTYNRSNLMASKIAAVLGRRERGIGEKRYSEKGRDIYDLIWYMSKKVWPDLDYLRDKELEFDSYSDLFSKLEIKINKVTDESLRVDMKDLFIDKTFFSHWLVDWRNSFGSLLDSYYKNIHNLSDVIDPSEILIHASGALNQVFFIDFHYETKEGKRFVVRYRLSDFWLSFREEDVDIDTVDSLSNLIELHGWDFSHKEARMNKLRKYVALFNDKNKKHFKKSKNEFIGDFIETKLIRMTGDKLNIRDQIMLSPSALKSCELEDLMK